MTNSKNVLNHIPENSKIYFIGIDGISMSGLAAIALNLNFQVSGSDPRISSQTRRLIDMGVEINNEQVAPNILNYQPDLVVYSSAIPDSNPELLQARELNINTVTRAEFLGWLTRRFDQVINIAGTHGKSTTSGLTALILMEASKNPTVHLGSEFEHFDNHSVRLGSDTLLVNEADEYKKSFLNFNSTSSAILNIDADHLDYYGSLENIIDAFVDFALKLNEGGNLILPADADNIPEFLAKYQEKLAENNLTTPNIITFGEYDKSQEQQADFYYKNLTHESSSASFEVYKNNEFYAEFTLGVPGKHNVSNALVAIIMAHLHGSTIEAEQAALTKFKGVSGRFDYFGSFLGADVVADYAHHPTEIEVTLEAANEVTDNRIWPIVQILNYSRARDYYDDYIELLKEYPFVVYYKIYSSREFDDYGQSAEKFAEDFSSKYNEAVAANSVDDLVDIFKDRVEQDDLILFLGPEDLREAAREFCKTEHGTYNK